ncbi:MAG TPA: class II glutamine amidotransferase, partial [Janthinobacterium sp.]|nr:class II glutamine amidotransferase [Janthinobacterium sp.]
QFHPPLTGAFRPVGNTDSEQAFCFILQQLRARFGDQAPALPLLRSALGELVRAVAAHGTFNLMLSDGSALFAHCSTSLYYVVREYPFVTAQLSDDDVSVDFSQVTTPNDRVAVIVTQPLTSNETWTAFAPGELRLFVDGKPQ